MRFFPQSAKHYKKTATLTDIIAVVLIWAIALHAPSNILVFAALMLLNAWIWFSGPIFTKLGESILKNRSEDKD